MAKGAVRRGGGGRGSRGVNRGGGAVGTESFIGFSPTAAKERDTKATEERWTGSVSGPGHPDNRKPTRVNRSREYRRNADTTERKRWGKIDGWKAGCSESCKSGLEGG